MQDDIRVRTGLTLSPGLRYEIQTHVSDFNNFGPRFGVTWSPFRSGRTSLRASAGIFYDWLSANTYEQTLRVDGFRQRELTIADPSYPDPGDFEGVIPPANRYLLSDAVRMPRNLRFSGGIDQAVTPLLRVGVTYAHARGTSLQRGLNLNAPVNGVRPDPAFVNVVQVTSDAQSRLDTISVNMDGGLSPPTSPFLSNSAPLVDWKRVRFFTNYTLGWSRNDTDGDFSLAPGTLEDEWGFAPQDVRHRLNAGLNGQILRNLTTTVNLNSSSGTPYTLRTGFDENGDLVFNDRPAGAERNTERAAAQWSLNLSASYALPFGRRTTPPPPGFLISVVGKPGAVGPADHDRLAVSPAVLHPGPERDEPRELHRLQRRLDVAFLRRTDESRQPEESGHRNELSVLANFAGLELKLCLFAPLRGAGELVRDQTGRPVLGWP